ncbi:MAG: methyltransferase domain-containing protein [Chloroflexi bacterium]|nr:methyltransferase domain-containing protein [Chloroflexota bacterium]
MGHSTKHESDTMIDYDSFEEFRDPVTYDVECDAFADDFPCIEQWAQTLGGPLLDLACGTGRMSLHMAALGYTVTGVDLIPEMIAHARLKAAQRALSVEWVVADARSFQLNQQFPLIFMLMNAFQFLLTREDHEAMLARVREHLQPGGCFIFETRNPSPRNLFQVRHPEGEQFTLPDGGQLVSTEEQVYDPLTQIQHYTGTRRFTYADGQQKVKTMRVALRYVFPQEMETLLFHNGFQIRTVYGDWQQNPLTANSRAMIYVCERRA